MIVCMLTWEYPPRIVGGISRHCFGLARALSKRGCEVHVVTLGFPDAPSSERVENVNVHRVLPEVGTTGFLSWVLLFNNSMSSYVTKLRKQIGFDVVHSHDWLTIPSGLAVSAILERPLVITFHSTESGRSLGSFTAESFTIEGIESSGIEGASRLVVASRSMMEEVCGRFKTPQEKVRVIPNAFDLQAPRPSVDVTKIREQLGISPSDRVVLCVGRLTPQKGVEFLIQAAPEILKQHPDARFVIVGDGWARASLQGTAKSLGVDNRTVFTGFVPEDVLSSLFSMCAALVVPSVYEPFGIVALEGMAGGSPLIVSQTGGLAEVVEHEKTGLWVYPRNPKSIAWGVDRILSNPELSKQLVENARAALTTRFTWDAVAVNTIGVYEEARKAG